MEVFEVKEKKGLVKLPGGLEVEIRIPSVFEAQVVQKNLTSAEGIDGIEVLKEFYFSIGLKEEHLKHFDSSDFNRFFMFLLGEKKS